MLSDGKMWVLELGPNYFVAFVRLPCEARRRECQANIPTLTLKHRFTLMPFPPYSAHSVFIDHHSNLSNILTV
jgi:hypothetical protein